MIYIYYIIIEFLQQHIIRKKRIILLYLSYLWMHFLEKFWNIQNVQFKSHIQRQSSVEKDNSRDNIYSIVDICSEIARIASSSPKLHLSAYTWPWAFAI